MKKILFGTLLACLFLFPNTVSSASWGEVDFRILSSEDPLVMPLVIDFTNNTEHDLEAKLVIETYSPEVQPGPSEYEEIITIPSSPDLMYLDLHITEEEKFYDVWVNIWVNDEYDGEIYNSLVRTDPKNIDNENNALPPLPADALKEGMEESDALKKVFISELHEKYPDANIESPEFNFVVILKVLHAQYPDQTEKEIMAPLGFTQYQTIDEAEYDLLGADMTYTGEDADQVMDCFYDLSKYSGDFEDYINILNTYNTNANIVDNCTDILLGEDSNSANIVQILLIASALLIILNIIFILLYLNSKKSIFITILKITAPLFMICVVISGYFLIISKPNEETDIKTDCDSTLLNKEKWQIYNNPRHGYLIQYPIDWTANALDQKAIIFEPKEVDPTNIYLVQFKLEKISQPITTFAKEYEERTHDRLYKMKKCTINGEEFTVYRNKPFRGLGKLFFFKQLPDREYLLMQFDNNNGNYFNIASSLILLD